MPRMKDKVHAFEGQCHLRGWLRAGRRDVGIRNQTNFHDTCGVGLRLFWCIEFQPREPWLCHTLVVPQEFESRLLSELFIQVPVADV